MNAVEEELCFWLSCLQSHHKKSACERKRHTEPSRHGIPFIQTSKCRTMNTFHKSLSENVGVIIISSG